MSELTVFPTIINFVLLSARERDEERETEEEQKRESVGLTTAVAALIRP